MQKVIFLILTASLLNSCFLSRHNKVGKKYITKEGIAYTYEKVGDGRKPKSGEKIKIHFEGKLPNNEVFASSYKRQHPVVFQVNTGQVIKGWDNVFPEIYEGSIVNLEIPSALAYGNSGLAKVPSNTDLTYKVDFLEILTPPVPYNVTGKDTFKLESGLQYIIAESSSGRKADSFRKVKVHYTGYLEDGNIFDSSIERGFPFEFQLSMQLVIQGWDEGILSMRAGEKFRFIIPSNLAYGDKGMPPIIPGGATLIYDVELLEIAE